MNIDEQKVKVGDIYVNYKIAGAGRQFLILHGWGGKSDSWTKTQQELVAKGYQVIAPDLPGFGKTPSPDRPWSVDDYKNFVIDFAKELNINNFALLGHSFGGRIAIKLCARNYDRVSHLILCDSAGITLQKDGTTRFGLAMSKIFHRIFIGDCCKTIRDWARDIFYRVIGNRDFTKADPVMRETFLLAVKEDLAPYLEKIFLPTQIIWGEKDAKTPLDCGRYMQKHIRASQLYVIAGEGHAPNLTSPQKVAEIADKFLKQQFYG